MTDEEIDAIAHMLAREALEGYEWLNVVEYADDEGLTDEEALAVHRRVQRAKVVIR